LDEDAKILEMLEHIRADEACHRELNHHFASIPNYGKVEFHSTSVDNETGKVELKYDKDLECEVQLTEDEKVQLARKAAKK
jgi:hypothetical protein